VLARYTGDPRIRVLTQPNLGLPAALSNAFRFAGGAFRTWTSADNLMEPQQLSRLTDFLTANPGVAMVYADYTVIGPDGAPLIGSDFRPQNRATPESSDVRLPRVTSGLNVLQDNFIGACFLYRGWVGRLIGDYSSTLGVEDYDYWMRINAAFGIEHLGSRELLYRYRWHDNSLNARARELRLFEAGQRLMAHERRRTIWRVEPWRVLVDEASAAWIGALDLAASKLSPFDPALEASDGKQLAFLSAGAISVDDLRLLPEQLVLALEWTSPGPVYRWAEALRDPRLVHFAADPVVAAALHLFTDQVFELGRGAERLTLAMAAGNERVCGWRAARAARAAQAVPAARPAQPAHPARAARAAYEGVAEADPAGRLPTPLPRVFIPAGSQRRLLLQVEDFAQGGLECVVLDLIASLAPHGFEATLLVLGEQGAMADVARAAGVRLVTLADRTPLAYRALLETERVGLVMAHQSLFGAAIVAELGKPFVQVLHTTCHWFFPAEIEAWRAADAMTTAYIHVSANVALYAHAKLGLDPTKGLVIENGVDLPATEDADPATERAGTLRSDLGIAANDFVFLHVASIYPPKAQTAVARALARARREDPSLKVVLLGRTMNEGYAAELAELVVSLGLDGALIRAGFHDDVEPFYRIADALVLPSYWEGCSMAVAEALVRDLPCVLTDVGAARQQLAPGEGQLLAPPFGPIETLDFGNLKAALAAPRPDFVDDLATAMLACTGHPGRLPPSPSRGARFDLRGVAARYARVLDWLATGGRPAQARPFTWARYAEGELW
jgi:glycosyltransferase involved in cell wall biosynthesis